MTDRTRTRTWSTQWTLPLLVALLAVVPLTTADLGSAFEPTHVNEAMAAVAETTNTKLTTQHGGDSSIRPSEALSLSNVLKSSRLPRSVRDVRDLSRTLRIHAQSNKIKIIATIVSIYIALQSLNIPGTVLLNILLGSLFGLRLAFVLGVLCGAVGASCSFVLSRVLGQRLIQKWFPSRVQSFSSMIDKNRESLFHTLLFLRISPLLPNWFINVSSPIIGIPFGIFFITTLLGISPATFVAVRTGTVMEQFSDSEEGFSGWRTTMTMMSIALIALIPYFARKWMSKRKAIALH